MAAANHSDRSLLSRLSLVGVVAALVVMALAFAGRDATPARAHAVGPITLTTITTAFNNPIGIDCHEPTNQIAMSVNYSNGQPHNFELVAADGTHAQFSTVSGFTNEVKIATVRSGPSQGSFTPGELFVGTGTAGVIARISADGSTVTNPWVTLAGETGLMRGSLFQDRYGSFGGDLIAVTTAGGVWRITSAGGASLLTNLSTHLEGVTTVPNDPQYGPWAGKILAGAEQQGRIYAIDASGASQSYELGIDPEDFDIVPPNENFFGVNFGGGALMGAPASEFAGMVGDIIIADEFGSPNAPLWNVHWDAGDAAFHVTKIAGVTQWEHVTFCSAGVAEIPPVGPPAVGGVVELRTGADAPAEASGSSVTRDYVTPIAAAVAAGALAIMSGGWYARRRWRR
jgi:hypothetical protein